MKKYSVVRSSRDPEGYQQIDGEGSKTNDLVMAKKGDDPAGDLQLHPDHQQQEDDGDDRTVDQKQRDKDHRDADQRDCGDRSVAAAVHIRGDRRGPRDICLEPRRRRCLCDDLSERPRSIRCPRASPGVTGEIHLNICGLTIRALRGTPREFVTPEILDVLHMLRVGFAAWRIKLL